MMWPTLTVRENYNNINDNQLYYMYIILVPDSLGLHRVENPSHSNVSVSLHLYCPPIDVCSVFNKNTGKRTKAQVTFWSKFGERRDKVNN